MFKTKLYWVALAVGFLAACDQETKQPQTVSTSSESELAEIQAPSAQSVIDSLAANLQIQYEVLANRGDGGCNLPGLDEASDEDACFEAALSITSPINFPADALGREWAIYFSQTSPLLSVAPGEFRVEHLNGDLHRISPNDQFVGFHAGETKTLHLIVTGISLTEAKIMPNYYVTTEGDSLNTVAKVIDSTRLAVDPETGLEVRPYAPDIAPEQFKASSIDNTPLADAAFLYQQNQSAGEVVDDAQLAARLIVPTPNKIIDGGSELDLSSGINLQFNGVERNDLQAALVKLADLGIDESADGVDITVEVRADYLDGNAKEGSYQLAIGDNNITILAADVAGAFYGFQSLVSLVNQDQASVAKLYVQDEPRYDYRGMHVDVGRNFHSRQLLLDMLDQMATYKLNKLHLHLGEDEGWRLEIPGLPELTDIGSKRCHDPSENTCLLMQLGSGISGESNVDGYYSRADYIELIKAANARQIQLIPSFDMPGHSRAAVKSMQARYRKFMALEDKAGAEQYLLSDPEDTTAYSSIQYYSDNTINACMDSSYDFLSKVIDEVKLMHEEAGQPLTVYHIGADETAGAWVDSPRCQAFFADNAYGVKSAKELGPYFIERVASMLHDKGIEVAGWSDGLSHTDPAKMPARVQSNIWDVLPWAGVAEANRQANLGWDVVLSTPDALYFDFPYEAEPKEGGYYWATRHTNTRKVFNFMPGNLPAMAEIYVGPTESAFSIADTTPLKPGVTWRGIQGQIWSETIRSDEVVEYMVFPRLLALAERAWHKPSWELPYNYEGATYDAETGQFTEELKAARDADWRNFANTLGHKEFARLDAAGIQYRIPTVGAVIDEGQLKANLAFPGLGIEYRIDGGDWQRYSNPEPVDGTVEVRAIAADGKRRGRSLMVLTDK